MNASWSTDLSREIYAIEHWGEGYFDINQKGHVVVYPAGSAKNGTVDLVEIVDSVRKEGLALPVLVRFKDILRDRIGRLTDAFNTAKEEFEYLGNYTPIYPIKVNQQRGVVEGIIRNDRYPVGLEAGSKSELLAILALSEAGIVICNGYKDRSYIRLALIGRSLGLQVFIVIEKLSELAVVMNEAEALGIDPQLGVRVRLSSISAGKWQNSGGEKSKFGLHSGEILKLVEDLKRHGKLGWLKLMHFHMGSQIADIGHVKTAVREAGRYYAELRALGADIQVADVGGGLGVDYEGTRSTSECSLNYSLDEYAASIIRAFSEVCAEYELPHPDLLTESGRAMSAHHAVLITHITDVESVPEDPTPPLDIDAAPLEDLAECLERLPNESVIGIYHDAQFDLAEARAMFVQGQLSLAQLAEAERLNAAISHAVRRGLDIRLRAHRELLDELNDRLADKVFCNFSLFQSMPDAWAIGQVFPVMPLQRLLEEPTRRCVIQDLTCDSDGRIDAYIDCQSLESTVRLHAMVPGESYLIGIFLVGAYQEILGDMHNLFGDTHSINIALDGTGGYQMLDPTHGDGADDMLRYVNIEPEELERAYRKKLLESDLTPERRKQFESELIAGLGSYTYLEEQ
ncbi:MAG: biosynthetic arginine decarboxylase [Methylococcus sp.]|jgi:arginine decarboxylase|nr:MAG: biosynthetic arginine decarboxylase [Methylococcus sp.]